MKNYKDIVIDVYNNFPKIGQNRSEFEELCKFLVDLKPVNIVEIGTQYGGTFYAFCNIASGKKISIDLILGPHGGINPGVVENRNAKFLNEFQDVYFIEGNSRHPNIKQSLIDILQGEKIDFLFIDGDHTYEGVKSDYLMYKEFVKSGGYIGFHDINESEATIATNCFVKKFWDELNCDKIEFNHHTTWGEPGSPIMGGIGVIKVE